MRQTLYLVMQSDIMFITKKIDFTQITLILIFYYIELFQSTIAPTNRGIPNMLKRTILSALFLAGSVLPITVNLIVFMLIIRRKELQQVRFYIIANLLLADMGVLLIHSLRTIMDLYNNQVIQSYDIVNAAIFGGVSYTTYLNSILTTGFLAIDRYVAVKYTFHYETMLTKRRIIFILSILWFLSVLIPIVLIKVSSLKAMYRNMIISLIFLRLIVSLVLLALSKYTHHIKEKHMESIAKRKNYFGVEQEKFDKLKSLKSSLKDSFKFFIANVAVMSVLSFISVVELVLSEVHLDIKAVVKLLSQFIDIVVISLSYREIREQIKRTICKNVIRPL